MRGERSPARGGGVISRVRRASEVSHFAQTFRLTKTQTGVHGVPPRLCWGGSSIIDTPSQSIRSFFQVAKPGPTRVSVARSETCRAKGNTMQVPSILQGDSLKRLLQGAAAGAVATMFVGFVWGGWSLRSTADKIAKDHSELAVIAALAPVCADRFRALPDADARKAALSKVDSWKRQDEFPKEFVTLPGETYPSSTLVDACYTLLVGPKSAELK
jgi:hypothetical protein